ncbi:MarR family transcriptional regulator [Kibdelosporangium persicum]
MHQSSGLTPAGYEILMLLAATPEHLLSRRELTEAVGASRQLVSKTLAGLERRGFVKRGRRHGEPVVRLSTRGWAFWSEVHGLHGLHEA